MNRIYFFSLMILFASAVKAQDTHFSQFYTSAVYLNPALAGVDEESKLTLNYRNQWPSISNSFITQNVSFENNISNQNSGFAINAYKDKAGDGMLSVSSYSGVFAHEVKLKRNLHLRLGISAGVINKKVAWDKLIFEDMIDSRDGVVFNTQQKFGSEITYFDFSSGLLLYSDVYYGGFAIDHLNQAEAGLIDQSGTSKQQIKYTFHGGAKFRSKINSDYSISPNVLFSKQATFTKVNLGMYFEANSLVLGAWYGSNDVMTFLIGLKGKRFQVGYSYDLYPTTLVGSNLGSHEISYVKSFKVKDVKRKRYRTTPCPKF